MAGEKQDFEPLVCGTAVLQEMAPGCGYWQEAWGRLKQNREAVLGLAVIVILLLLAIFGPMLSSVSYAQQDLLHANQGPSAAHWFGTDHLGRDLFIRVLCGARISLSIGLVASLLNCVIGVVYGGVAGFFGGRIDRVMMNLVDVLYAVPALLYIILLMVILKPGLTTIFIALGIANWLQMARMVRGEILTLKEQEFVLAAQSVGAGRCRILLRHLIPNCMGVIIVCLSLAIPEAIFAEAFLSFIGLGVSAPMASWGVMASQGLVNIEEYPLQLFFPAVAISLTILSFNFLSEAEMCAVRGSAISMIFQDPMTSLNPVQTIGAQLRESLQLHRKLQGQEARARAVELLAMVGIPQPEKRLEAYPHEFSGGMRQRVMIAMALACEPRLLLADEPTTALDVTIQAQILDLLADLKQRLDTAIVLISHDLGVVANLCDQVAVMYAGGIVERGAVRDIFCHPQHP